jgi:hypothetical protein
MESRLPAPSSSAPAVFTNDHTRAVNTDGSLKTDDDWDAGGRTSAKAHRSAQCSRAARRDDRRLGDGRRRRQT